MGIVEITMGAVRASNRPLTRLDFTERFYKDLRQRAHPDCQQCKGEGVYPWGTGEKKLCRCTGIHR